MCLCECVREGERGERERERGREREMERERNGERERERERSWHKDEILLKFDIPLHIKVYRNFKLMGIEQFIKRFLSFMRKRNQDI